MSQPSLLKNRNFSLLIIGETISHIGDQFTFIAFPWLVLKLTNDPLALGFVMALSGIPRAVFMLIGGAITDRYSPKNVMLLSNVIRLLLISILTALVFTDYVTLWMVYTISLLFGTADAFFIPAQTAIVPMLTGKDQLQQANTISAGSGQLSQFIGPMAVGTLIGLIERGSESNLGISVAFAVDALTFMVSLMTLWLIQCKTSTTEPHADTKRLLHSIKEGVSFAWHNRSLRYILVMIAAMNLFLVGPFLVGIPVIAKEKFGSASMYGLIMSMWGVGSLIGYGFAGFLPKPKPEKIGIVVLSSMIVWALFFASMGVIHSPILLPTASLLMAIVDGYVTIHFITTIQHAIPEKLMGRVMSVIMFSSSGLIPVSQAAAGALARFNVSAMILYSGLIQACIIGLFFFVREVREMGIRLHASPKPKIPSVVPEIL